jgi:hypothetical protein
LQPAKEAAEKVWPSDAGNPLATLKAGERVHSSPHVRLAEEARRTQFLVHAWEPGHFLFPYVAMGAPWTYG